MLPRSVSADKSPFRNRSARSRRRDGSSVARVASVVKSSTRMSSRLRLALRKGELSGSSWKVSGQSISSAGSIFPGSPPAGAVRTTLSSKYLPWRRRQVWAASGRLGQSIAPAVPLPSRYFPYLTARQSGTLSSTSRLRTPKACSRLGDFAPALPLAQVVQSPGACKGMGALGQGAGLI
jgi:hypothetical protein